MTGTASKEAPNSVLLWVCQIGTSFDPEVLPTCNPIAPLGNASFAGAASGLLRLIIELAESGGHAAALQCALGTWPSFLREDVACF